MNYRILFFLLSVLIMSSGCVSITVIDLDATATAVAVIQGDEPTTTPVPTHTPIPTDTPTPEPTHTPMPTATLTPEAGLIQSDLADEGTLYELPEEGFSISLPEDWQIVDLDKLVLSDIMDAIGEQNEDLEDLFTNEYFQRLIAVGIKFYALNLDKESIRSSVPATINVIKQELPFEPGLDVYSELNVSQLDQFIDLTSDIEQEQIMLGETEAIRLSYTAKIVDPFGRSIEAANTQYLMLDGSLAYIVTLSMPVELSEQFLEPSRKAAETFRLMK